MFRFVWIAENITKLFVNSMEKWRVMLCAGNSKLGEIDIEQSIFQGDSLFPLVFVSVLIPYNLIFRKAKIAYELSGSKEKINHLLFIDDLKLYSNVIGMEFGIEECAMLKEKEKIVKSVIKVIKSVLQCESYKYLEILKADRFLGDKMKLNVSREYFRRLKKF